MKKKKMRKLSRTAWTTQERSLEDSRKEGVYEFWWFVLLPKLRQNEKTKKERLNVFKNSLLHTAYYCDYCSDSNCYLYMDTISEIRAMITEITDKTVLKITIPFVQNHSLRIALISCLSFSKNFKISSWTFWFLE